MHIPVSLSKLKQDLIRVTSVSLQEAGLALGNLAV